ncbi:hypothetical protein SLS62_001948 [Diatrype stigma]|uniref:Uncharacterized protein n=1 Tax=Diatrype stigma TaxID=117547 RepID=A0AAN9YW37_9PEZI
MARSGDRNNNNNNSKNNATSTNHLQSSPPDEDVNANDVLVLEVETGQQYYAHARRLADCSTYFAPLIDNPMTPGSRHRFLLTEAEHHATQYSVSLFAEWLGVTNPYWDGREIDGLFFAGPSDWVRQHTVSFIDGVISVDFCMVCHLVQCKLLGEALGVEPFVRAVTAFLYPLLLFGSCNSHDNPPGTRLFPQDHPLLCQHGCLLGLSEATDPALYRVLLDTLLAAVQHHGPQDLDWALGRLNFAEQSHVLRDMLERRREVIRRVQGDRADLLLERNPVAYARWSREVLLHALAVDP